MKLLLILLLAVHSLRASLDVNVSIEGPASAIDEVEPSTPVAEDEDTVKEGETVGNTASNINDPTFPDVEELMEDAEDLQEPEHSSPSEASSIDDEDKTTPNTSQKDDADLPTEADEEEIAKDLASAAEAETEQPDPELLQELQELQNPVEAVPTATGASATMEGVTVRFELQETWAVRKARSEYTFPPKFLLLGGRNRGYTVIIENESDKEVCSMTFMPNAKMIDLFHLSIGDDGTLSTKGLALTSEGVERKFGYISSCRSLPTIIAVSYCYRYIQMLSGDATVTAKHLAISTEKNWTAYERIVHLAIDRFTTQCDTMLSTQKQLLDVSIEEGIDGYYTAVTIADYFQLMLLGLKQNLFNAKKSTNTKMLDIYRSIYNDDIGTVKETGLYPNSREDFSNRADSLEAELMETAQEHMTICMKETLEYRVKEKIELLKKSAQESRKLSEYCGRVVKKCSEFGPDKLPENVKLSLDQNFEEIQFGPKEYENNLKVSAEVFRSFLDGRCQVIERSLETYLESCQELLDLYVRSSIHGKC
ncbi:hypothetical protein PRIPAC_80720 [Pristionchus pacificus]|uniref:Uncharacterized protein n=1 Tax=Pristionchus pacificus TaxID=54126 RepID=A0A2A6BH42_PRIPA|nr:hypothetical protein PRIPAC_80720 [Pristionchus pacificus]|eukprot:PDM65214.1 hypothetical protein PRIPAC_52156 [Pristionchus pacificus]